MYAGLGGVEYVDVGDVAGESVWTAAVEPTERRRSKSSGRGVLCRPSSRRDMIVVEEQDATSLACDHLIEFHCVIKIG